MHIALPCLLPFVKHSSCRSSWDLCFLFLFRSSDRQPLLCSLDLSALQSISASRSPLSSLWGRGLQTTQQVSCSLFDDQDIALASRSKGLLSRHLQNSHHTSNHGYWRGRCVLHGQFPDVLSWHFSRTDAIQLVMSDSYLPGMRGVEESDSNEI